MFIYSTEDLLFLNVIPDHTDAFVPVCNNSNSSVLPEIGLLHLQSFLNSQFHFLIAVKLLGRWPTQLIFHKGYPSWRQCKLTQHMSDTCWSRHFSGSFWNMPPVVTATGATLGRLLTSQHDCKCKHLISAAVKLFKLVLRWDTYMNIIRDYIEK